MITSGQKPQHEHTTKSGIPEDDRLTFSGKDHWRVEVATGIEEGLHRVFISMKKCRSLQNRLNFEDKHKKVMYTCISYVIIIGLYDSCFRQLGEALLDGPIFITSKRRRNLNCPESKIL